jgi:hypothetical protein
MAEKRERGKTPRILLQGFREDPDDLPGEIAGAPDKPVTEPVILWVAVKGVEGGPLEAIPRDKPGLFKAVAVESWQGGLEVKEPEQPQLEAIPLEGVDGG